MTRILEILWFTFPPPKRIVPFEKAGEETPGVRSSGVVRVLFKEMRQDTTESTNGCAVPSLKMLHLVCHGFTSTGLPFDLSDHTQKQWIVVPLFIVIFFSNLVVVVQVILINVVVVIPHRHPKDPVVCHP